MSRTREYTWEINDRLRQILDSWKGLTRYGHDELGNLAWAQYDDGTFEYRMPDAVAEIEATEDTVLPVSSSKRSTSTGRPVTSTTTKAT